MSILLVAVSFADMLSMGVDMIGNAEEAAFIASWYRRYGARLAEGHAPRGWKYLGAGSYRSAYLSPSGVVYKIQKDSYGYQSNEGEWAAYKRLYYTCKMPKHSRLPKMGYFPMDGVRGVIAAEFIPKQCGWNATLKNDRGERYNFADVVEAIQKATKIGDLWGANVRVDANNLVVPTDIADDRVDY